MNVIYQKEKNIAVITLNRAKKRNALNLETVHDLSQAFDKANSDESVSVIVLLGDEPAFCAGSDLSELAGLSAQEMAGVEAMKAQLTQKMALLSKPIICAVEGYALGGGMALAAACDVLVVAQSAKLHMPEVKNGWIPPWGLAFIYQRLSPAKAKQFIWGAKAIQGQEALQIGLADYCCPDGTSKSKAMELAAQYGELPAHAVTTVKAFHHHIHPVDIQRIDSLSSEYFIKDCQSDSAKVSLARFKGKK